MEGGGGGQGNIATPLPLLPSLAGSLANGQTDGSWVGGGGGTDGRELHRINIAGGSFVQKFKISHEINRLHVGWEI